jgi:D-alanyl-lipoteichoic acid acyltransferase DltB (MBOAT superfamily)
LPQLRAPRDPRRVAVSSGLSLIALGIIKKVVISDFLATKLVDPVFATPVAYKAPDVLLAAYGYAAQIYCDFSGYTDMAIGLALLLGFILPQNFRSPYRSTGIRDFWRRWHMSLSRFIRDDLFIPLGGSRGGALMTYRNLMITFVLVGLWHGAAWTFVLWGAFHGICLVLEHAFGDRWKKLPVWVRWLVTFHLIVFGWILFRATSLTNFWAVISRLTAWGPATLWTFPVLLAITVVIGFQLPSPQLIERVQGRIERLRPALLACGLAVVIIVAGATVSSEGVPPFIYFRF